jgi:pyruvate dehydrogenase phosphatase
MVISDPAPEDVKTYSNTGHGGTTTSEYTSQALPGRIQFALRLFSRKADQPYGKKYQEGLSALLSKEIENFDRDIGEAVKRRCRKPQDLTGDQAHLLIQQHSDILSRAYHGTTLIAALVNRTQESLWVAGVGDSTAGKDNHSIRPFFS